MQGYPPYGRSGRVGTPAVRPCGCRCEARGGVPVPRARRCGKLSPVDGFGRTTARSSVAESAKAPTIVVVMGVSGSGKTHVGRLLAHRRGVPFVEGDGLHPARNVARMSAGEALDDRDREPWLRAVAATIRTAS